jgi:hypothetical protein
MTVDQLALCGCVSAESRTDSRIALAGSGDASGGGGAATTEVSIVNFMCPLGSAGIAQVMVKNGIAQGIYY